MSYTFEYGESVLYDYELDIEELGQVSLKAEDTTGLSYYLVIKTSLGFSSILEFGPLKEDATILPLFYDMTFKRIEFDEVKLKGVIRKFIGPRKKMKTDISKVSVITTEEALDSGVNLIDYMRNYSEEQY